MARDDVKETSIDPPDPAVTIRLAVKAADYYMILSQILCFWKRRCGSSYEALSRNKARIDLAFLVHMVLAAKAPLLFATARYAREGLGTLGNAWERQLLSWHVLKIKRGHTDGTENTDKRKLVGSTS
ncbi:MAG TPA: hypothetical protein PLE94_03560, partial [Thermotogota bacterium]|nr:hypothetical protein [Thermotogota bacterium]